MKPISKRTCLRCGATWYPRKPEKPVRCAKCRSPYWATKRQVKARG